MSYNPGRVKARSFKWFAVLMMLVVLAASLPGTPITVKAADQSRSEKIAALNQENEKLESQIAAAQSKMDGAAEEKELTLQKINNVYEQITLLSEQISGYEGEIAVINSQIGECDSNITALTDKISEMESQISQKETDIEENYELFKRRMRSLYMTGEVNTLTVLLNSEDFADYLLKTEISKKVAKHDQELISTLKQDIEEINQSKAEVEASKADLESQKTSMVEKREASQAKLNEVNEAQSALSERQAELERLYRENSDITSRLSKEIQDARDRIVANKKEIQQANKELEESVNNSSSNSGNGNQSSGNGNTSTKPNPGTDTKPSGGGSSSGSSGSSSGSSGSQVSGTGYIWPVPGYAYQITSGYGPRWGSFHYGIDISGYAINGKNVVASKAGTVTTVMYSDTGYGNRVMITHDDGQQTLYAHCSSLLVSNGQRVEQGQVIARVGSTGNSTGPHLHFEVRVGGSKVNPMHYLP
ncbi:MAG: peptidoglycan DD-metalloendopeptidase family protein [Clostridiales bacterium]|nr:peptidoglycan DD-metalloendopeptidase family protein [Clostridiales bacterium]